MDVTVLFKFTSVIYSFFLDFLLFASDCLGLN